MGDSSRCAESARVPSQWEISAEAQLKNIPKTTGPSKQTSQTESQPHKNSLNKQNAVASWQVSGYRMHHLSVHPTPNLTSK